MTDKITTILYRYKLINGSNIYDTFFVPNEDVDNFIGGIATEINKGEIIYQIYDVADETVFSHPWVSWWDKKVIENEVTLIKLPSEKGRNINWKSRNRGGGVRHKNFDKSATKPYKSYTETPKKPNKSIPKTITEPPMGIIGIIKKDNCDDKK